MPSPLSKDLLTRALRLHEQRHSVRAIALRLCVDRGALARAIKRAAAGERLEARGRRGVRQLRSRMARCGGYEALLDILHLDEQLFLDEIRDELERRTGEAFHTSSVCRALQRLGWSKKNLHSRAKEASARKQAAFRRRMRGMYKWWQLVWLDETAKVRVWPGRRPPPRRRPRPPPPPPCPPHRRRRDPASRRTGKGREGGGSERRRQ